MMRSDVHIGIVGGGLVGGLAALELSRLGFRVTLFDREKPMVSRGELGIDIRNFALSPASQNMLDDLGVWRSLEATPYATMTVWEEWGVSEISFHASEVGRAELGWIVETSPLLVELWGALEASEVELCLGGVEAIELDGNGASLDGMHVDFLIGADGGNSRVRAATGAKVKQSETGQAALATVVRTEEPHCNTAWQRFLQHGPIAFLPASDPHVCSVVWSQPPAEAEARRALAEDEFCKAITRAFEQRLGKVSAVDKRVVFPLVQQRVENCAPHPRVLLIGDAMRVIHPLAGLGVNIGLEDVRELVKNAGSVADITAPNAWRRFARMRHTRSDAMIAAMSTLQRVYGSDSLALRTLRNVGVKAVDEQGWIKRPIMREALGLTGFG